MALQKQFVNINFAQGLDQKSDPKQIPVGKFADLQNSIFDKTGLLQKRNGYQKLPSLPVATSSFISTYNGNLTAVGSTIYAYSKGSGAWINRGDIQPSELETLSLIKSNVNQSQVDTAVSGNLICTVYTEKTPIGTTTVNTYKYVVADVVTGQNIVSPTVLTPTSGTASGSPRVFVLGSYFLIIYTSVITATSHLTYLAVSTINPSNTVTGDLTAVYTPSSSVAFDGYVANNTLFFAWNGSDGGGAVRVSALNSTLTQYNTVTFAGRVATVMSVTADTSASTPVVYVSFFDSASSTGYVLAVNQTLVTILAPTQWIATGTITNVTSTAVSGTCRIFYETAKTYSYNSDATNFVSRRTCSQAGSLGTATVVERSVGLASKAFLIGTKSYMLVAYQSPLQPSYFLIDFLGNVISQLAYSNGGGYLTTGLPSAYVDTNIASFGYLIKDLVASANTTGVYSQTGINLAKFTIGTSNISSAEISGSLNLTGGFLWQYDGYAAVENGFFVYPDSVFVAGSGTGGTMTAQQYFYCAVYEWADNNGYIQRSSPSIVTTSSTVTTTGTTSSVTINVPTLRLTYKTANPVKITVYRASAAQATFYQVTSIAVPLLNDKTIDSVSFVDKLPDASIIGNTILYTTGGTVENIPAPPCKDASLYKSRVFIVDSEDRNLLWYSKQVIESTPVEMSDLFTLYVAPTIGAQGSTSGMEFTVPMDDKLIIFKKDAIYYLLGIGPDNTGANNDFSEPVFITSTVGSINKQSVVFIPQGLMFQSDKGIWLLGRDLSTRYIGDRVEDFTKDTVESAVNVPGTNQVRFTLSGNVTLMYDYYFDQWGTFIGIPATSSTIYEDLHTFINSRGEVYQEAPGSYVDGGNPVLMKFKTGPLAVAGLQGFQRAYCFNLIGQYITPHTLSVSVAYDYSPNPSQVTQVEPDNFSPAYGGDPLYGSGTYGGVKALEQWQIFFSKQKCQAIQITVEEIYDASMGIAAGAGLTMSGLNFVFGVKDGTPKLKAARSVS